MTIWPDPNAQQHLVSPPAHELGRTIALATAEESRKMHDFTAAVHHSALVLGMGNGWRAAGSSAWALTSITGTAGGGLARLWLRPLRVEDGDVGMSSAAGWVRRVLLRGKVVGVYKSEYSGRAESGCGDGNHNGDS